MANIDSADKGCLVLILILVLGFLGLAFLIAWSNQGFPGLAR